MSKMKKVLFSWQGYFGIFYCTFFTFLAQYCVILSCVLREEMHISAASVGAAAVDTLFDMVNFSKLPIMAQNYNISIGKFCEF